MYRLLMFIVLFPCVISAQSVIVNGDYKVSVSSATIISSVGGYKLIGTGSSSLSIPRGTTASNTAPASKRVVINTSTGFYEVRNVGQNETADFFLDVLVSSSRVVADVSVENTNTTATYKVNVNQIDRGVTYNDIPLDWTITKVGSSASDVNNLTFTWGSALESSLISQKRLFVYNDASGVWCQLPSSRTVVNDANRTLVFTGFKGLLNATKFMIAESKATGNLTIVSTGGSVFGTDWTYENGLVATKSSNPVSINKSDIETYFTSDIEIEAANVTIEADLTSSKSVTLITSNAITLNGILKTTASSASISLKGNTTIASTKYIQSSGNFTHDGNLVFKSDVNGTAAFGTLGGTFTKVSGTATVERYVPAKRAWRLVTAPLKGATSTTINSNWRQGVTGEGLLLFSPSTYLTSTMTGYTTGGGMPNIWNYNNGWQKIDNIDTETMFNTNNSDTKAYLVFATGPQSSTNIVTGATATTLKPKGDLISGSVSLSLTANQFKLIPNPYACPINTVALRASNPGSTIWMVDPTLSTVGGYYAYDGTNWAPTTPAASDAYIQSGQGFFVRNASAATFTISESHKVIGNSNTWFERTTNNQTTENTDKIRVLLNKQDGANWQLADGILAVNAATGNNDLDATDTQKMLNFNENIMFRSGTTNLAIEYSALPQVGQVQPMYLTGTTVQPYQLQVFTEGYSNATVTPFLQDTTTGTFTAIPTDGTIVTVPFTGIATTSTTADQRFKIVYQSTVLNTSDFSSSWASVYPNPVTNNVVNIQLKSVSENTDFTLTNLLGQIVHKGKLNNIQNAITLPELQKGMYLITVNQEGKKYTTKLYIQ